MEFKHSPESFMRKTAYEIRDENKQGKTEVKNNYNWLC